MSFLGLIRFVLKVKGSNVTKVEILPAKEVRVENLLCGKTPKEALELIPPLFALCPDSQLAAAMLALQAASQEKPDRELVSHARFINHLEIINEGVRYFALQCADANYRAEKIDTLIKIRKTVETLKTLEPGDTVTRQTLWAELRSLVAFMLLDGFSTYWEQDLFNGTIKPSSDSLSHFFFLASAKQRTVGYCSAPLCNKNATFLLEALRAKGCWERSPWNISVEALTGPVARMDNHPTISGLLAIDGNTNFTRFTARFIEVLCAADLVRVPLETVTAFNPQPGLGVSLVQNSRGVLLHSAEIKDGVIANYNILTPTEINVTNDEWFKKTLAGLKFIDIEELKKKAEITILSFDPCTQFEVEVQDA